jgi:hypothetical protein
VAKEKHFTKQKGRKRIFQQEEQEYQQEEACNPATNQHHLETLSANPTLRSLVAGNPSAPAHVLSHLASNPDVLVRKNVASNPNTPWQTLEYLATEFPHAFLHNPVGPLQMIASPEAISIDGIVWDALLREAAIPAQWWNWLLSHPTLSLREAVHLHVQYAGETLHFSGVPRQGEEKTLLTLVEILTAACGQGIPLPVLANGPHVDQPKRTYEQIIRDHLQWLASRVDPRVRLAVVANPLVPVEVLRTLGLSHDQSVGVRWAVAEHLQTPVEVLQTLALDEDEWVRSLVASHARTPVETLQALALDQDAGVRWQIANRSRAPVDLLCMLALDPDPEVRKVVARNQLTPGEVLQTLALSQEEQVRCEVARNSRTPLKVLQILALDHMVQVRSAVAGNPQTSPEMLQTLALDADTGVRWRVVGNGQISMEVLRSMALSQDASARRAVASHPQAPVEVLQTLALDQEAGVRQLVASHSRTPLEVLQRLALDQDGKVRWLAALVQRLETEVEGIEGQEGWREKLRALVLETPDTGWIVTMPIEMQLDWVSRIDVSEPMVQTIIAVLAADWETTRRKIDLSWRWPSLATNLHTRRENYQIFLACVLPPIALQKLAESPCWDIRYLVALHERTPPSIRQRLSQDGNRYVRAVARAKLSMLGEPLP